MLLTAVQPSNVDEALWQGWGPYVDPSQPIYVSFVPPQPTQNVLLLSYFGILLYCSDGTIRLSLYDEFLCLG